MVSGVDDGHLLRERGTRGGLESNDVGIDPERRGCREVTDGVADQPVSLEVLRVKPELHPWLKKPPPLAGTPVAEVFETVADPGPWAWTTKVPTFVILSPLTETSVVLFGPRNM